MNQLDKTLELPLPRRRRAFLPHRSSRWANRLFQLLLLGASLSMLLLILTPLIALVLQVSPAGLLRLVDDPATWSAVRVTAVTSVLSTVLVLTFGLPVAYALSRHQGRGRLLLEMVLELPMVLPPVVAGLGLLLAFGRRGLVGSLLLPFGIQIPFTLGAVVLAQMFVLTPFFVKRAAVLFAGVDRQLETAAMLLGAGPFFTFFRLTLPLCRRALLAETVMALAQGIGLFGAVILFAGNLPERTRTLSLAIYGAFEQDPEQAFTLAALMLAGCCALLLVGRLLRRSPGGGGGHG